MTYKLKITEQEIYDVIRILVDQYMPFVDADINWQFNQACRALDSFRFIGDSELGHQNTHYYETSIVSASPGDLCWFGCGESAYGFKRGWDVGGVREQVVIGHLNTNELNSYDAILHNIAIYVLVSIEFEKHVNDT